MKSEVEKKNPKTNIVIFCIAKCLSRPTGRRNPTKKWAAPAEEPIRRTTRSEPFPPLEMARITELHGIMYRGQTHSSRVSRSLAARPAKLEADLAKLVKMKTTYSF